MSNSKPGSNAGATQVTVTPAQTATFNFDPAHGDEAKGQIKIVRCGYGVYIEVDGKTIALVDLFPNAQHIAGAPEQIAQLITYTGDPSDDPVSILHWTGKVDEPVTFEKAEQ